MHAVFTIRESVFQKDRGEVPWSGVLHFAEKDARVKSHNHKWTAIQSLLSKVSTYMENNLDMNSTYMLGLLLLGYTCCCSRLQLVEVLVRLEIRSLAGWILLVAQS